MKLVALLLVVLAVGATRAGSATLHVQVSGSGTVTSSPDGIDCPSACSESFDSGMRVALTAHPAAGESFLGWGGGCSGSSSTCTLTMDVEKIVAAKFTPGTLPALTIDDVTTHETNVDIVAGPTVTLAPASTETVTVHYATSDGTADSTDYNVRMRAAPSRSWTTILCPSGWWTRSSTRGGASTGGTQAS